jgi:hypothetical protein
MPKWGWWAVTAFLGWYFRDLIFSSAKGGLDVVTDFVGAGDRLTVSTHDDAGVIREDPEDLRAQAEKYLGREVSEDAYALARMVRSEAGSADLVTKVRLANVAMNQARALGWSPYQVIVFHTTGARDGRYGSQITGRFASGKDPYEIDQFRAPIGFRETVGNRLKHSTVCRHAGQ